MGQIKNLETRIKFKDTPIGKIPVDWEVTDLGSICNEIYRYPTYYNIEYVEQGKGVPEVRDELIKDGGELSDDLSNYRYISEGTSQQFPRTILHEGDFVISVRRSTLGKTGYVSKKFEGANVTADLMRISPKREKAYPPWLKQYFLGDFFQTKLHEVSSVTTIKTIKMPELRSLIVTLPPFSEQKKIAEILSTIDLETGAARRQAENLETMKRGLTHILLTGKIRVKLN